MQVSGVNGAGSANMASGSLNAAQASDPVSKSLEQQIQRLKEQQKELSANQDMSLEMKSKKRQELQKQISQLEMELRQHQIDVKREEAQKKKEKSESLEDMMGGKPSESAQNGQSAGLSQSTMQAMISADSAMEQASVQGSVATRMEGRAGVLEGEIKLDQSRGMDTKSKEEELAEVKATAQKAEASQIGTLARASEELQEAAGKEDTEGAQTAEEGTETGAPGAAQDVVSGETQDADASQTNPAESGEEAQDASAAAASPFGQSAGRYYQPVDVRL